MLIGVIGRADTVQKLLELDLLEPFSRKREDAIGAGLSEQREVLKYKKETFLEN